MRITEEKYDYIEFTENHEVLIGTSQEGGSKYFVIKQKKL